MVNKQKLWAEIDINALEHNYNTIRNLLDDNVKILAVIKADAYGNGAVPIARQYERLGVDYFGVSSLDEAMQLRNSDIKSPILILGYTPYENVDALIDNNITQTVFSLEYANNLNKAAKGKRVKCHLKIDTAMSRIGIFCQDASDLDSAVNQCMDIMALNQLDFEGIFTHFSCADEPDNTLTKKQFDLFTKLIALLENQGKHFEIRHCCNSAATIENKQMHLDMVRPGIILYGLQPSSQVKNINLKPIMSEKSHIAQIKTVKKGSFFSYGATYVAQRDIICATIPVGYADGYSRLLSQKAYVLIDGKRANILGKVCMDQFMVDITDLKNVDYDSEVIIFGKSYTGACLPIDVLSDMIGTINYELSCAVAKRVAKYYIKHRKVIDKLTYIV